MISRLLLTSVMLAFTSAVAFGDQLDDQVGERMGFWRSQAFHCLSPSGYAFPAGAPEIGPPGCEDGDMVLFAGLLCSAGEMEGCETVRRSQRTDTGDDFGRWYRSPRRMENRNDADEDGRTDEEEAKGHDIDQDGRNPEREWNTFSFDMALGAALYLVTTDDRSAGQYWWNWLGTYTPCVFGSKPSCPDSQVFQKTPGLESLSELPPFAPGGDPRFCAAPASVKEWELDKRLACTLRPPRVASILAELVGIEAFLGSDYAVLAEVGRQLELEAPPGRFADELELISGQAPQKILLSARLNDEGYSEHIVGVAIYLMRLINRNHPDLETAAALLNCAKPSPIERPLLDPNACQPKDPENAFFLFLRDGPTAAVKQSVLARCPSPERLPHWRGDWIFQRHGGDLTWEHSMYWDCIFMGRLLGAS